MVDGEIDTNKQNMTCLGRTMAMCNKQHLSNIGGSNHLKIKQH